VLHAAAEQLSVAGYAALRIEDVAARSGVNKTTIYRRWPTKLELVRAVLHERAARIELPDTGELRSDILIVLRQIAESLGTPAGQGFTRIVQAEKAHPEVAALVRAIRQENNAMRRVIFERAKARGEIPEQSDSELLVELTVAPVISRIVHIAQPADERFLTVLTDMVVAGAKAGAAAR
jgi:AcrR family transcriptional regulator